MRHTKFNNRKVEWEGVWYDSKVELERWKYLKEKEQQGEIEALVRQFTIPYLSHDTKTVLFKMILDFTYFQKKGDEYLHIQEDTKGKPTNDPLWNLKRKLIEDQYGITIVEVRWDKVKGEWVKKVQRGKKISGV